MKRSDEIWKTEELAKNFLEGVRAAIPLAAEQLDFMLKIIQHALPTVDKFLDLGCGDGTLGRAILDKYPLSEGVFLDFSEPMLDAARQNIGIGNDRLWFMLQDFGQEQWVDSTREMGPFDLIVSGFAIHHQPDARKKAVYREIFSLLKPGGLFLNLEHVSSSTTWVESISDEVFIDSLIAYHQEKDAEKIREQIAQEFYYRPDKAANILTSVEAQCEWLKKLGFINVDCFFKVFEVALFGGMKPEK